MQKRPIGVEEKLPLLETIPLSLQHLFAMFGSTVLVPILFKINPATVLLFNGIGTILYLVLCKGKIPAYLGSSFAFLSPVFLVLAQYSYEAALGGFICVGIVFCLVGLLVRAVGTGWIDVIFPPASMGAIVAVIGLELMPTAAGMAGLTGDKADSTAMFVSLATLAITIFASVAFKGFLSIIPILIGVVSGYIIAAICGIVDWTLVESAPWFALPTFYTPKFDLGAILIILPASLVVIVEHIGHLIVTGNIVGHDLTKDPGLDHHLGLLRLDAEHDVRREHRRPRHHEGLLDLGHWRRGRLRHPALVPRQARCAHPEHPDACHGRRLHAALRRHRRLGHPHPRRGQGRLQQPDEPPLDVHRHGHRRLDGQPDDRHRELQGHVARHGRRHHPLPRLPAHRHRTRRQGAAHRPGLFEGHDKRMTQIRVELPEALTRMPVKAFLTQKEGISSTQWKRIKHSGTFRVNGILCNAARTEVRSGDIITFDIVRPSDIEPEDLPLDIRYEDDYLMVVNKPAGQLVHPTTKEAHGTLGNAVLYWYRAHGEHHAYHPVHRLDRNTSGLVLIAKVPQVQYKLTPRRGEGKLFHREYLALIEGELTPPEGLIDAPIARALPSIILRKVSPDGQAARTHYDTVQTDGHLSLVHLMLDTGRTHQIRVHLAHLGHPLLGDDLYGGSLTRIKRQALHAARLHFRHPLTNEMIDVRSPLPSDMEQIVSDFHHPKR